VIIWWTLYLFIYLFIFYLLHLPGERSSGEHLNGCRCLHCSEVSVSEPQGFSSTPWSHDDRSQSASCAALLKMVLIEFLHPCPARYLKRWHLLHYLDLSSRHLAHWHTHRTQNNVLMFIGTSSPDPLIGKTIPEGLTLVIVKDWDWWFKQYRSLTCNYQFAVATFRVADPCQVWLMSPTELLPH